jgi:hypothetical protein
MAWFLVDRCLVVYCVGTAFIDSDHVVYDRGTWLATYVTDGVITVENVLSITLLLPSACCALPPCAALEWLGAVVWTWLVLAACRVIA